MRIVISMLDHRLYPSRERGTRPHSLPGSLCRCVRAKISAILFHSRNFDRPNEIFRSNSPHGYVESYPPSPSFDHSVYINADILSLFSSFLFSVSLRLKVWHLVDFFFSRLEKRDLTCLRIESLSWKLWNINAGYAIKRNKAFFSLYFPSVVLHCCSRKIWFTSLSIELLFENCEIYV